MRTYLLLIGAVLYCAVHAHAQCSGPVIINYPYHEDFEAGPGGWSSGGTGDDWILGTPNKPTINTAASGTKCWVTGGLTGSFYTYGERAYVESPCFNFTALAHPYIRFKIWWESEYHFDGGNLQYSLDGGQSWENVGSINDPVNCLNDNWYNYPNINYLNGLATVRNGWSGNIQQSSGICVGGGGSGGWVEAKHCMNYLGGKPSVKFRFTFGAGTSCNDFDGLAFDDIYIQNAPPIVASFVPSCSGPNTYTFNDISTICPDSWVWNFGDPASGAANTSTSQNPTHTYPGPGVYTVTLSADNLCSGTTTAVRTVRIYDLATTVTSANCQGGNDGSATVQLTPTGGNPVLQWNTMPVQTGPTATGLAAGTYTVSLVETGVCPAMATVTVAEPALLQHNTDLTDASCGNANGAASINVSGGTGPYAYSWSPPASTGSSATGLSPGNYAVTITDAHGCTDLVTFNLGSSPAVQASIAGTVSANCFGSNDGSLTVTASGGTPAFNYAWSPAGGTGATASALPAGTYTVTVTDAKMCTATAVATVTQPPALQHLATVQQATCGSANGSIGVVESGGTSPYTYAWSPGGGSGNTLNNLSAGNYQLSVTDAHGCTDTVQVTITNTPPVQVGITNVVAVNCFGSATGSAAAAVSGGTAPFVYAWLPAGGTGATASGLAAGNYQVTVTDAAMCTATATVNIGQPSAFSHTATTTPAACNSANGSATVAETGGTAPYSYLWSPIGGTGATANNLPAGNYVVSVTDSQGCIDTVQINVGNIGGVQASVSTAIPVNCFGGQDGSVTLTATGGLLPYTYNWSPSGGSGPTAAGLAAGNYFVTVTDANLCIAAVAISIGQPPPFQHQISVQPTICGGANGSAMVTESGGTAPYTYAWSPTGGTGSTATSLAAGLYVVSVTDQHGCVDTAHITVSTLPSVQAAIATVTPVSCFGGSTGSATVGATSGLAPYSYLWPGTGGVSATATGLPAGAYVVTVTDANQCTATATANITQPAALQHTLTFQDAACGGANGSATVTESGGTAPYVYAWLPGGGSASTALQLPAGNYVVSITDQQSCVDTAHVTIGNIPGVQAVISGTAPALCFGGNTGSITVTASIGALPYQYAWTPSGGNGATATNLVAGTYTVTVTDSYQCTATATATVTQPLALLHQVTTTPVTCGGMNGSATITETGGTSPYTYQWSPSGGNAAMAGGLAVGNYTLSITDAHGCTDTVQVLIGSVAQLQTAVSQVSGISCAGSSDGSVTVMATGGLQPYTYAWSPAGNGPALTGLAPGPYAVTVTDATGCTSTETVQVPNAIPIISTWITAPVRCPGEANGTIRLDTTQGGLPPYLYALGTAGFGQQTVFPGLPGGNYTVQTQDANGCVVSDPVIIIQPSANPVEVGADTTINIGDSLRLEAVVPDPGRVAAYAWMPPSLVTCPTCASTFARPFVTTTYTVQVTDSSGCVTTDRRVIRVNGPSVYIPNVFAPAANGDNDHFTVYAGYGVEEVELMQVYDRWGELVFESQHFAPSGFQSGWNGKVRDQPAATGVYVYVIRVRLLDGRTQFFKGDVTVIR